MQKSCGADVIKFQTYSSNEIATPKAPKAKYQIKNSLKKENMYQMLKKYELSFKNFEFLKNIAKKKLNFSHLVLTQKAYYF